MTEPEHKPLTDAELAEIEAREQAEEDMDYEPPLVPMGRVMLIARRAELPMPDWDYCDDGAALKTAAGGGE